METKGRKKIVKHQEKVEGKQNGTEEPLGSDFTDFKLFVILGKRIDDSSQVNLILAATLAKRGRRDKGGRGRASFDNRIKRIPRWGSRGVQLGHGVTYHGLGWGGGREGGRKKKSSASA